MLFTDDHLLLRPYADEDAEVLFRLVKETSLQTSRWLPWMQTLSTQEKALDFIRFTRMEQESQQALWLGIFEEKQLLGGVSMHRWDQELKKAELGYWLSESRRGKGIVSRSLKELIRFLFTKTDIAKLEIRFVADNRASARVAEAMRFRTEGVIRRACMDQGQCKDLVITGMLREEWIAL